MKMKKITDKEILKKLQEHRDVLRKYHVKRIGLFGSYARGEEKGSSDIDLWVDFEKPDVDNFMNLAFFLEDIFGKKVELVTNDSLSPYIRPYIEKEVKWYEGKLAIS